MNTEAADSVQDNGPSQLFILLDAAKAAHAHPIDLSQTPVHFVALSFYKIFGYPTGLGALLVRTDCLSVLTPPFLGGGTLEGTLPATWPCEAQPRQGVEAFEPGTSNFLAIRQLQAGFDAWVHSAQVEGGAERSTRLAAYLASELAELRNVCGTPVVDLYGWSGLASGPVDDGTIKLCRTGGIGIGEGGDSGDVLGGATVAFNVRGPSGDPISCYSVASALAEAGVLVRAGCCCNPGACAAVLGLSDSDLKQLHASGWTCGGGHGLIQGRHAGVVRASFGVMSVLQDAQALVAVVRALFAGKPVTPAAQQPDDGFQLSICDVAQCEQSSAAPGEVPVPGNSSLGNPVFGVLKTPATCPSVPDQGPGWSHSDLAPAGATLPQPQQTKKRNQIIPGRSSRVTGLPASSNALASPSHSADQSSSSRCSFISTAHKQASQCPTSHPLRCSQHASSSCGGADASAPPLLAAIHLYPVKSCGGMDVPAWPITPQGLLLDHAFQLINRSGRALTSTRYPQLAQLSARVDLDTSSLTLTFTPRLQPMAAATATPDAQQNNSVTVALPAHLLPNSGEHRTPRSQPLPVSSPRGVPLHTLSTTSTCKQRAAVLVEDTACAQSPTCIGAPESCRSVATTKKSTPPRTPFDGAKHSAVHGRGRGDLSGLKGIGQCSPGTVRLTAGRLGTMHEWLSEVLGVQCFLVCTPPAHQGSAPGQTHRQKSFTATASDEDIMVYEHAPTTACNEGASVHFECAPRHVIGCVAVNQPAAAMSAAVSAPTEAWRNYHAAEQFHTTSCSRAPVKAHTAELHGEAGKTGFSPMKAKSFVNAGELLVASVGSVAHFAAVRRTAAVGHLRDCSSPLTSHVLSDASANVQPLEEEPRADDSASGSLNDGRGAVEQPFAAPKGFGLNRSECMSIVRRFRVNLLFAERSRYSMSTCTSLCTRAPCSEEAWACLARETVMPGTPHVEDSWAAVHLQVVAFPDNCVAHVRKQVEPPGTLALCSVGPSERCASINMDWDAQAPDSGVRALQVLSSYRQSPRGVTWGVYMRPLRQHALALIHDASDSKVQEERG
jgi:selenocysteine lyase/cysteine desulfurase